MPPRTMTLAAWKKQIGPTVPLDQLPSLTQKSPQQIATAIKAGDLAVQTFRGSNGTTYQRVRLEDLLRFLRQKPASRPKITMEDMARAFRQMVGETHLKK